MDFHLLTSVITVIILAIFAVSLIRQAFGPEDEQRQIMGRARPSTPGPIDVPAEKASHDEEVYPSMEGVRKPRRSIFSSLLTLIFLAGTGYIWHFHGSLDSAVKSLSPATVQVTPTMVIPPGADHAVIDDIRWFRLVGTDSSGIGYQGWVSELAFRELPPEPSGASGTDAILKKIGLPTTAETVKAAKQMRKVGEQLRLQNRLTREK